jgi:hypothetical protein
MIPTELIYVIGCVAILLLAPIIPSPVLLLLDNIFIRIAAICLLVYSVRFGPTVTIFVFITLAVLFLERNRRKVGEALKKLDAMEVPKYADVDEAYQKTMPVEVPTFSAPVEVESDFIPHESCSSGEFEPVDMTINQKAVLSTIYPLQESTDELYEKMGFGHVEGVHTMS